MYLTKIKNGYYYVYYIDEQGKRNKISTRTKIKSEARKYLISFQGTFGKSEKFQSISLKQNRWNFLKHSESYHSWKTTLDYKSTFNELKLLNLL